MEDLQAYIQRVAAENKIILDPKDPLCALHTILTQFDEDTRECFKDLLHDFIAQLELEHTKNANETLGQMQALLELTLKTAREHANITYTDAAEETMRKFESMIESKLIHIKKMQAQVAYLAILNGIATVCFLFVLLWFF